MMKRLLIWFGLATALFVQSANPVPDVGNGRIRVLGNNLQNYYYNYEESSRPSYNDDAGRAAKTHKIMDMMLTADADIYAFCEVEAKPIVLQQLVDSLNLSIGTTRYATISDNINVKTDQYDNALKSGFIYRTDKVKPHGSCYAATSVTYYKNVMRIQAWEELRTGERFTLSMNHFKAMSDDASVAKRVENANWLIAGLTSYKVKDPDILIMGDLNAMMDEEAISIILNAGYEEQLLRYDADAYTYCYRGDEEFIDHALANASMASQITGAAVWHINTTCGGNGGNYSTRYSDHDPYLVALNLGGELPDTEQIETPNTSSTVYRMIMVNGILLIERAGKRYTITGQAL